VWVYHKFEFELEFELGEGRKGIGKIKLEKKREVLYKM
jgi:hypothetical protein